MLLLFFHPYLLKNKGKGQDSNLQPLDPVNSSLDRRATLDPLILQKDGAKCCMFLFYTVLKIGPNRSFLFGIYSLDFVCTLLK